MDAVGQSVSVAKVSLQYVLLHALILIPVLAWNSVIQNGISRAFPESAGSVWLSLLYAILVTGAVVVLLLTLPLQQAEQVTLGLAPKKTIFQQIGAAFQK